MTITVVITDESVRGETVHTVRISIPVSVLSVRELLRERIRQEAARFNLQRPVMYRSLVYPQGCEVTERGFRLSRHRDVDWEAQYAEALAAFAQKSLSIYIDDVPVDSLDDPVQLDRAGKIAFVQLSSLFAG